MRNAGLKPLFGSKTQDFGSKLFDGTRVAGVKKFKMAARAMPSKPLGRVATRVKK